MNAFLAIDFTTIDELAPQIGVLDVPCPLCGPERRSAINRRRKVLRIWRLEPDFATFHCARCGERGHVRNDGFSTSRPKDLAAITRAKAEADARERVAAAERLTKARWLWSTRQPITSSVAETYLREARGYHGPIPATLGYLVPRGEHTAAMIAAFGIAYEPEPGLLDILDAQVRGVHLTRLAPDGSGKAGTERDKIMLGSAIGYPIILAPPNDLLGLAIAEGIEDALSVHDDTGLGTWAAGSASRLPEIANAVPRYIEAVTIAVDDDETGGRNADELAERLLARGVQEVRLALTSSTRAAA
jgi:Toprim domain-containing protein